MECLVNFPRISILIGVSYIFIYFSGLSITNLNCYILSDALISDLEEYIYSYWSLMRMQIMTNMDEKVSFKTQSLR